jgi:hypothetical protein
VMSNSTCSNVSREQLLYLVEAGQLPPLTDAIEWRVPGDEYVLHPQGVCGVVRGLSRARLLHPRWPVYPRGAIRVRAATPAPQPE